MADIRIKDISRTVTEPKSAEYVETDHATDGSGKLDLAAWLAARRNALAARGGLAFDGTASTRVYSTLTNQNIGTDAFSLSMIVRLPATAESKTLAIISTNATSPGSVNNSFNVDMSGGNLRAFVYDAAPANYRLATLTGVATTYAGKTALLKFVRNGAALKCYVNGVDTAYIETTSGTAPTWGVSITGTYLSLGYASSADVTTATIYSASLYNLALTQADVTEIYELGGAVPERFKFGSQVSIITGDSSTFASSAGNWNTWGAGTFSAGSGVGNAVAGATTDNGDYLVAQNSVNLLTRGRRFRLTLTLGSVTGGTVMLRGLSASGTRYASGLTSGTTTVDFDAPALGTSTQLGLGLAASASGVTFTIDNILIAQLGAVCHYDADLDGIGYQLHDQSTNKLDAVITTTGVSWTKPARRGYVRATLTWAGTHEGKSLLGQAALETDCVVDAVSLKPTVASSGSGATVGTTASATRYLGLTAITTSKTYKRGSEISNGGVPGGTGATNLDLLVDPDTANYTGSINVNVEVVRTEGTA